MHFTKLRDKLSKNISEIEFLLFLCCLKQIASLSVHLINLKCMKCVNVLRFECHSRRYQKTVRVPLKMAPKFVN